MTFLKTVLALFLICAVLTLIVMVFLRNDDTHHCDMSSSCDKCENRENCKNIKK